MTREGVTLDLLIYNGAFHYAYTSRHCCHVLQSKEQIWQNFKGKDSLKARDFTDLFSTFFMYPC